MGAAHRITTAQVSRMSVEGVGQGEQGYLLIQIPKPMSAITMATMMTALYSLP